MSVAQWEYLAWLILLKAKDQSLIFIIYDGSQVKVPVTKQQPKQDTDQVNMYHPKSC